jgi:hypothetical protein
MNTGNDLRLSDYDKIKTPFCFLDETGLLNSERDRFFSIGMVKCSRPYEMLTEIEKIRHRQNYTDEAKWQKVFPNNLPIYKMILDVFFSCAAADPEIKYCMMIVDKKGGYFKKHYHDDPFQAYEDFSIQLLRGNVSQNEILSVIADESPAPSRSQYENNVKKTINDNFGRLAIPGICKVDSKGNDLLQIVDLLVGAITYDSKVHHKLAGQSKSSRINCKKDLLEFIKNKMGVKNFTRDVRVGNFNVKMFS